MVESDHGIDSDGRAGSLLMESSAEDRSTKSRSPGRDASILERSVGVDLDREVGYPTPSSNQDRNRPQSQRFFFSSALTSSAIRP